MFTTDPTSPDFLFLALIGAVILIIVLQTHFRMKQQPTIQALEENKSRISSLSALIKNMTGDRKLWAETVEKTQENLLRMFMELEEAKKLAGLLPSVPEDQSSVLKGIKEPFTELFEARNNYKV